MGLLKFTKTHSAADDGSTITGAEVGQLEADIAAVLNGGVSNVNVAVDAAIVESKLSFNPTSGHHHDGLDSRTLAGGGYRGYIHGAELVWVDTDNVKCESGVIEIGGVIYTRISYTDSIDLDTNSAWVEGTSQRAISTVFYVYAYNDTGDSYSIKYWKQPPQYANTLSDTSSVLLYRQSAGVWYRALGTVTTDTTGTGEIVEGAVVTSYRDAGSGEGGITTVFSTFAGDGSDGPQTVSVATDFTSIDSTTVGRAQYTDLTINALQTLTINTGIAVIGVSGTLTVSGTISADGQGEVGVGGAGTVAALASMSSNGTAQVLAAELTACLSGAGGGGGGTIDGGSDASDGVGIAGGGGGGAGGTGGTNAPGTGGNGTATDSTRKNRILSYGFPSRALMYRGAAGGAGGGYNTGDTRKSGGNGGGVIYIECTNLVYTGVVTSDGAVGINATVDLGAGGGGGGGLVVIRAQNILNNTGTTTVTGGTGGSSAVEAAAGGNGADGYSLIVEVT